MQYFKRMQNVENDSNVISFCIICQENNLNLESNTSNHCKLICDI